jgi:non-specific serine/threonine protein kinase
VSLAHVLSLLMRRPGLRYTPGLLSRLSGVPKTTIVNWLVGRVAQPRLWQDLVRVGDAMRLAEAELDALLAAGGHPPLATLLAQARTPADRDLLSPWLSPAEPAAPVEQPPWLAAPQLPAPAAELIGRAAERAAALRLLADPHVRLLTLTGPAGVGKTHLALQVAADIRAAFADGVYFVGLTALSDHQLVVPTVARAFGLTDGGPRPMLDRLAELLANRRALLLLDNLEHLLTATPTLGALMAAAPGLVVLATSRVVLRLSGEHELVVPPLALPDLVHLPPPEHLAELPAVALFLARVRAVRPEFQLTPANAAAIAAICVRLDGLPLALELAAARSKLLAPRELLARLDQRLQLLNVAYADRPRHQQTLRGALDWSYRLLPPTAQLLLARLSIFMGGWTLGAAEAICADGAAADALGPDQILDDLMTLVDHSLVQTAVAADDSRRYSLLESIRVYGRERLEACGELPAVAERHAAYYAGLAEEAGPALVGPQQVEWLGRLDHDHDNLRAALGWGLGHQPALAGRIGAAIWRFWLLRGYLEEGQRWLEQIAERVEPALRAEALLGAGRLARQQGALEVAEARLAASLAIQRERGDEAAVAVTLGYLGVLAYDRGDFARAEELHQASLQARIRLDDRWGVAATLTNLGEVARQRGELDRALAFQQEGLARFRALGDRVGSATALLNLGMLELARGRQEAARPLLRESLALWAAIGEQVDIAECLEGLAGVAALDEDGALAAQLAGAAAAVRDAAGSLLSPADQQRLAPLLAIARRQIGPAAFDAAWREGRQLPLAAAVALADTSSRTLPPTT